MRVAAIDIGTNSLLLLIADVSGSRLEPLCDLARVTRLGQGVDATARLSDAACERTLATLRDFAERIARAEVDRTAAVATSALRDAQESDVFLDRAEEILRIRPRIISGREEAELTFGGALLDLPLSSEKVAICDIGGGSTEIMVGSVAQNGQSALADAVSLDVGCVRLTERLIEHDPVLPRELDRIHAEAREALLEAPDMSGRPLVGVAGTITTLAATVHGIWPYDSTRVHGCHLSHEAVRQATESLAAKPLAERKRLPTLESGRADVIVAGAALLDELMACAGANQLTVSDRGIRWGLARRLAAEPQ